jgi:hypothetical protein
VKNKALKWLDKFCFSLSLVQKVDKKGSFYTAFFEVTK